MKPEETMKSIENSLRARQFLLGEISKKTLEWAQKPKNKQRIENERLLLREAESSNQKRNKK